MSQVVDSFLDSYFAEGRSETAALELRLESLRRQREELQTELDRLESDITTVQGALEDHRGELNERINAVATEFADRLEVIDANHVAVRDIASEFDMSAEQVANRIRGRME